MEKVEMTCTLYGDGVHDDAPAILERLDSGVCCVALPLSSDWNRCSDWGLVWAEGCSDIGSLKVTGFHRIEETTGTLCLEFESAVRIESLILDDFSVENGLPKALELLHNDGVINHLRMGARRLSGDVREIGGSGIIRSNVQF